MALSIRFTKTLINNSSSMKSSAFGTSIETFNLIFFILITAVLDFRPLQSYLQIQYLLNPDYFVTLHLVP
jgi:hypothetical protein